MYDLRKFTIKEMTQCGAALRDMESGSATMEDAADKIVHYIYDQIMDGESGGRACVLVRLFKVHPYAKLEKELQRSARTILGHEPENPDMRCLTLLATAGESPEWNSRKKSAGHKAIPLASSDFVAAFPMISNLVTQLGMEINQVVRPEPGILLELAQKKYNVFLVSDAVGSPLIPAQDSFVRPFGVKSVLGCGGIFPSGDLFALILFSKVPIDRQTATLFRTIALDLKIALLPFTEAVFR